MSAKKYYRKELGVEAMQVEEGNVEELGEWLRGKGCCVKSQSCSGLVVLYNDGWPLFVVYGSYLIFEEKGLRCVHEVSFKKNYLLVSDYKKSIENWFALD